MNSAGYIKQTLRLLSDLLVTHRRKPVDDWRGLKAVLHLLKYRIYSEHPRLDSLMFGAQKSLPV